jgi:hypothetical protein
MSDRFWPETAAERPTIDQPHDLVVALSRSLTGRSQNGSRGMQIRSWIPESRSLPEDCVLPPGRPDGATHSRPPAGSVQRRYTTAATAAATAGGTPAAAAACATQRPASANAPTARMRGIMNPRFASRRAAPVAIPLSPCSEVVAWVRSGGGVCAGRQRAAHDQRAGRCRRQTRELRARTIAVRSRGPVGRVAIPYMISGVLQAPTGPLLAVSGRPGGHHGLPSYCRPGRCPSW